MMGLCRALTPKLSLRSGSLLAQPDTAPCLCEHTTFLHEHGVLGYPPRSRSRTSGCQTQGAPCDEKLGLGYFEDPPGYRFEHH